MHIHSLRVTRSKASTAQVPDLRKEIIELDPVARASSSKSRGPDAPSATPSCDCLTNWSRILREQLTRLCMSALAQMHQTKKSLRLIVFLFFVLLGVSEIPENIRLSDDVSNDFVESACGYLSVQSAAIRDKGVPNSASGPAETVSARIVQNFRFPSPAEPLHLSGQDCLLLWSIQRI
jgi:hypothetical protein